MKIAWFTPFSTKSAIGKYSQIITEELAKTCEVDLWISDTAELLDTTLRVILFSSEGNYQESLLAYDYVIYNLGNYLDFHKHIYNISCQHPGLVILHDFVMQHFFVGYHYGKDEAQYIRDMDYYYGPEARRLAAESFKFKRVPLWETDEAYVSAWTCACGSSHCRRHVTGQDWRDSNLQRAYQGHFSPIIEKRILTLGSASR